MRRVLRKIIEMNKILKKTFLFDKSSCHFKANILPTNCFSVKNIFSYMQIFFFIEFLSSIEVKNENLKLISLEEIKIKIISSFDSVELQGSVHAGRGQPLSVSSKANSRCCCCVVVEYFQLSPLLAQINSGSFKVSLTYPKPD